MKVQARWLIGLAISVAALALAARGVDLDKMLNALQSADYRFVVPGVLILLGSVVFRGLRWRLILGNKPPLQRTTSITAIGYLVNNTLPLRVGELVRAYLVSRGSPVSGLEAVSSVMVERVLDVLAILVVLVVILPLLPLTDSIRGLVAAGSISVGGLAVVLFLTLVVGAFWPARVQTVLDGLARRIPGVRSGGRPERVRQAAAQVLEGLSVLADWRRLPGVFLWTGLIVLSLLGAEVCLLWAFEPLTVPQAALVLVVTALGISVPSSPGSFGAYEAATKLTLLSLPVNHGGVITTIGDSRALAIALTLHAVNYLLLSGLGAMALVLEGDSLSEIVSAARAFGRTAYRRGPVAGDDPQADRPYVMRDTPLD